MALAAGVALQALDSRAPLALQADAAPMTAQPMPQPTTTAAPSPATSLPILTIQHLEAQHGYVAMRRVASAGQDRILAGPLLPIAVATADPPASDEVQPAATVSPVPDRGTQGALHATMSEPRFSLMPADFLHDDLSGKYAPALKRLLKCWGFCDTAGSDAWQAQDGYHLSLYQRWAGLKPSGAVDAATRASLLATWQKYADGKIPRKRLPLEGVYIGLNPGHQNRNYDQAVTADNEERFWDITVGTRGRATGLYEYQLNLTVALKARDALQALGARVLLSRTSNDVRVSNSSRTRKLNNEQVDAVLLIHADGNADASLHGLHMIVSTAVERQTGAIHDKSLGLAGALQSACIGETHAANMGVGQRDDLRILLSSCAMPAALIEMGYMTNAKEDRLLATDAYQNKIVVGIAQGFLDFFGK